jgi:environmental stress-induced protein Ves
VEYFLFHVNDETRNHMLLRRAGRPPSSMTSACRAGTVRLAHRWAHGAAPTSIIRYREHQLVPWKNGQGFTRVVAADKSGALDWLWRLSIAAVDRDGPFSNFCGYDRVIMLLQGEGMTLDFGDHAPAATLDSPFQPFAFNGGWPCNARLIGGPLTDFNIISLADHIVARAEVVTVDPREVMIGTPLHHSSSALETFYYVLRGACHVGAIDADERFLLSEGDCLRLNDPEPWRGQATAANDEGPQHKPLLYRIELSQRLHLGAFGEQMRSVLRE